MEEIDFILVGIFEAQDCTKMQFGIEVGCTVMKDNNVVLME
jgi:hypothetical protein